MKSPEDKTILVLANSMKKGGRCVAGVEITPAGEGLWNLHDWIRPVDPTQDEGTIPNHRIVINNSNLKPLDCVKIRFTGPAKDPFHPEDFNIDTKVKWTLDGHMGVDVFDCLDDEADDLWGAGTASSRKVIPKVGIKTLRLIKPRGACHVEAFRDETPWGVRHKRILHVTHRGNVHQFSIDDPSFSRRHNLSPSVVGNKHLDFDLDPSKLVIVASLTKPFQGFQYKIAATIFEL